MKTEREIEHEKKGQSGRNHDRQNLILPHTCSFIHKPLPLKTSELHLLLTLSVSLGGNSSPSLLPSSRIDAPLSPSPSSSPPANSTVHGLVNRHPLRYSDEIFSCLYTRCRNPSSYAGCCGCGVGSDRECCNFPSPPSGGEVGGGCHVYGLSIAQRAGVVGMRKVWGAFQMCWCCCFVVFSRGFSTAMESYAGGGGEVFRSLYCGGSGSAATKGHRRSDRYNIERTLIREPCNVLRRLCRARTCGLSSRSHVDLALLWLLWWKKSGGISRIAARRATFAGLMSRAMSWRAASISVITLLIHSRSWGWRSEDLRVRRRWASGRLEAMFLVRWRR